MSRDFNGSGDKIVMASQPTFSLPFTMAAWYRPDLNHNGTIMGIGHSSLAGYYELRTSSSGQLSALHRDDASTLRAANVSPSPASPDVWTHGVGVYISSASRKVYANASSGNNTQSTSTTSTDLFKIAEWPGGTSLDFNGEIAHPCVWDVELTQDEITSLANGASPLNVRRDQIIGYWPLWGLSSPEPDLSGNPNDGTVTGTTVVQEGPPVGRYAPRKRYFVLPVAAPPAGGLSIPIAMHHYKQMNGSN